MVRTIEGFPGYTISESGEVVGLRGRVLKGGISSRGYRHVRLCRFGESRLLLLHRILAEALLPNPSNLPVVRHLNDNKLDNRLDNLSWGSYKDNSADARRNGKRGMCGAVIPSYRIDWVRSVVRRGFTHASVAAFLGVNRATVTNCCNYKGPYALA